MKLYVESSLDFDPATAWEIFESDEYTRRLEDATDLVARVLESREEGGLRFRKLKYESKRDLPRVAAKALGMKHLAYEQHNRFDPKTSALTWEVFLPVMADRVTVKGITTITDAPGGSKRVVDGDISVRMRLIGGQVEKMVVAEFERSMERAVDLARAIHRERSAKG